jgi:hypothetical protein
MSARLINCSCQHCGGGIEFDADDAGQETECPHCHQQTWVDAPEKFAFSPKPLPARQPFEIPQKKKQAKPNAGEGILAVLTKILAVALFCVGVGLVFGGCNAESDEESRVNGSAIRQNVYAVQYCSGFLLLGLSPIVFAAGEAMAWMDKRDKQGKQAGE